MFFLCMLFSCTREEPLEPNEEDVIWLIPEERKYRKIDISSVLVNITTELDFKGEYLVERGNSLEYVINSDKIKLFFHYPMPIEVEWTEMRESTKRVIIDGVWHWVKELKPITRKSNSIFYGGVLIELDPKLDLKLAKRNDKIVVNIKEKTGAYVEPRPGAVARVFFEVYSGEVIRNISKKLDIE